MEVMLNCMHPCERLQVMLFHLGTVSSNAKPLHLRIRLSKVSPAYGDLYLVTMWSQSATLSVQNVITVSYPAPAHEMHQESLRVSTCQECGKIAEMSRIRKARDGSGLLPKTGRFDMRQPLDTETAVQPDVSKAPFTSD